jgi:hypothetical protein
VAETWLPSLSKHDKGQRMTYTDYGEPKGVLHTTETSGYPSYNGYTQNPHMDIKATSNGIEGRQFIPLEYGSFALKHTRPQQTNRDNVVQIELIGTCCNGPGYAWTAASDRVLADLFKKVIEPISLSRGIKMQHLPFAPRDRATRLTDYQFDNYSGWMGHEHVPQNDHIDPGNFPWDRMMTAALFHSVRNGEMKLWRLPDSRVFYVDGMDTAYVSDPDVARQLAQLTGQDYSNLPTGEISKALVFIEQQRNAGLDYVVDRVSENLAAELDLGEDDESDTPTMSEEAMASVLEKVRLVVSE